MTSSAKTVEEYLESLPTDRKEAISTVRNTILANLPKGFEESMQYGMISYVVPHSIYPAGYHCDPKQALPFISLASQKNHMAVYMFCIYCDPQMANEFIQEYQETGKKLDMGASCVRFKKLENLPVELIGKYTGKLALDEFISIYESNIPPSKKKK